jgi:prevent-host-death family protein
MAVFNIHDAKTHLSRLVQRAAAGEEIVIAKSGVPLVKLVVFKPDRQDRVPGALHGQIWMSPDFDGPLPEDIASAFRGERP